MRQKAEGGSDVGCASKSNFKSERRTMNNERRVTTIRRNETMFVRVKICGITNLNDALVAVQYGADALGFVFAPSKRQVSPATVREITRSLPPFVVKAGVFVNEDPRVVKEIIRECRLDLAQLHGEEPPGDCEVLEGRVIKVFKAGKDLPEPVWRDADLQGLLLDTYREGASGGTGAAFDWNLFGQFRLLNRPLILAGGLHPGNIREAIGITRPDGVDVSSGVESRPGFKDETKLREFFRAARHPE
jgi:phosphoribosylanthranilate isomerase